MQEAFLVRANNLKGCKMAIKYNDEQKQQNNKSFHNNHIAQILQNYDIDLAFKYQNPDKLRGISTGLTALDAKLDGLCPGDVVLIGGRPAMGKTSLAINMARNIATDFSAQYQQNPDDNKCVVYIGLEYSSKKFAERLVGMEASIPVYQMRGSYIRENYDRIVTTEYTLEKLPLYYYDNIYNIDDIADELQNIRREHQIGALFIDYLQLITPSLDGPCDDVMCQIKELAVRFEIPIIVLAQLDRNLESRADKRPMLCDIRGFESRHPLCANKVLFIYRESYYLINNEPLPRRNESPEKFEKRHASWEKQYKETKNLCEIIIAQNSDGYAGIVRVCFDPVTGVFNNLYGEYD